MQTQDIANNLSDASSLVPWVTILLGCAVSYVVGRLSPCALCFSALLRAGVKAFGLSIAAFFAGSLLHGLCIDVLHRCSTHGDGNITYAMGGVLAFPLFWAIMLWVGVVSKVEPALSITVQCDAACAAALIQHLEGMPDGTRCPACNQLVATQRSEPGGKEPPVLLRCSCGRCNKRLPVRPRGA